MAEVVFDTFLWCCKKYITSLISIGADIDECSSNPCLNGGTCEDDVNGYTCTCAPGYDGDDCETDVDECASNPCQNGGTCEDRVNGYTCTCSPGYDGDDCETDIDECGSNPCQNGGICEDRVNGYTCTCAAGYDGDDCETNVDECASAPCQNGGNCLDQVNGYTCTCPAGYYGVHCETGRAVCRAWGDPHYYPFDGGAHHFQGPCRYILAKDCGNSSDFTVAAQNVPIWPGAGISVVREVYVEAHGFVVGIQQGRIVTVGGVPHTLPLSLAGGTVEVSLSGRFVRVLLSNFSVEVVYDGSHEVKVVVPADYWGRMCGLCGNYNGDTSDDYMTPDGTIVGDWNTFGNSWLTDSATCPGGQQPPPPPPCNDAVQAAAESADNCGLLKNPVGPFGVCIGTVDPEPFFTSCVFDMCAWNGNTIGLCQNLEAYVEACQTAGVVPFSWRTEERCPEVCPPNSVFSTCASSCPATCVNPNSEEQCLLGCGEGCKCNPGFLLSGQECVPEEQCGCTDDEGRYYMLGERWREDGQNCICDEGNVITCAGMAVFRAWGDPHYYPFDGGAHHFQGPCRYILAKDCGNSSDFTVTAQNVPIPSNPSVSAVREVFVEAHGFVVGIHQRKVVTVGGVPHTLPFSLAGGTVEVSLSGRFVQVLLSIFSVEVRFDGSHEVKVVVPADYWGRMCGLGGNYNGDTSDDYMTPDGTIVGDWNTFGNSWLTDPATCPGGQQPPPPPPCNDAVQAAAESTDNCGLLTNAAGPFGVCHGTVDPERFFTSCVFDMCAWNGNTIALCQNLEAYVESCQTAGVVPFSWRTEERCPEVCPSNSQYSTCTSYCPATCPSPNAEEQCLLGCGEGCKCNPGFVLSGQECVPEEHCGCTNNEGRYYMIGETWGVGCDRICECVSTENIECREVQCDVNAWCGVQGGREGCHCNYGYNGDGTSCEPAMAYCSASGDPHYYPFDGGAHHFQGPCRYILAKDCGNSSDFTVTAQNVPLNPSVSAVREVYVEAHGFVVGIHQGKVVTVGGVAYSLPFSLAGGAIEVSLSGWFVRVFLSNFSVEVRYDGSHHVGVWVPGNYWGQMCGLCGNYNGDTTDDYMTPDGTIVGDWNTFGNSWLTDPATCPGGQQPPPPPPCNDAVEAAAESSDNCGLLKNPAGPFGVCHGTVDTERFFTSCVFDMCALSGDAVGLCQNLEAYAAACRAAG
ncbi:IgGFc-binding protein-like [Branchiostoma floridae]|uniref:IgGFc-binding protein-like n=1 Tax=Branchiostoma floridae TaxID=7739 RepID=A0A9J7MF91_BRAFL|nr:IgGFc-binding protein-like [Branchiostoma floridae]